jgi:hypothetical protein
MTVILNVTRTHDGQFQVSDTSGKLVDGPFDTNAAAWRALERLDNEDAKPKRAKSSKKVLWGKPDPKQSKRSRRNEQKQEHRMKLNAAMAPNWVRTVAASHFDPVGERVYRDYKLGTFGAASEVKRIDPAAYLAEKAARGEH